MTGRNSTLLVFLLLFCSFANASLLVDVSPKDPSAQALSLYLNEIADYELTVLNAGPGTVSNILVKVSSSEGLKIIDSGIEKPGFAFTIDSIESGSKETVLLKLKPTELSAKKLFLYVDYGVGEYTHLSATYLGVEPSPLQIESSLSKTALDFGEEGQVSLSLKNAGNQPIQNINAELLVFSGLESMNGKLSLESLAVGEGYDAKEFVFRADPGTTGNLPLVMRISFEDSLGRHVLEKSFSVEIQSKQAVLYLIIAVIILLIAVAIISRGRESKPVQKLEKPLVQEIEGKSLKPAKKA